MIQTTTNNLKPIPKIALIGSGGAGLITSRIFQKNNITNIKIFEKQKDIGGVWNYKRQSKQNPMYKYLRTNLPKEIMSLREKPWGCWSGDGSKEPSYVTHDEVLSYLKEYMNEYDLEKYINYNCEVKQLTFLENDAKSLISPLLSEDSKNKEEWPCIEIQYHNSKTNTNHIETFDAVCVCNGHYALPYQATIENIQDYTGIAMHSIEYDTPQDIFNILDKKGTDFTILCIGGRASGADIVRELSLYSIDNAINSKIYLSDSAFPMNDTPPTTVDNVTYWLPKTTRYNKESNSFEFDSIEYKLPNVDLVIFCSGYDYSFPFINEKSNIAIQANSGERCVSSLYKQLWYAKYPNLSFVGLQHSVIPFPLFEFQAEAIVSHILGDGATLPDCAEREEWAKQDRKVGGYKKSGMVQDTHYLGGFQWDYFRELSKLSNLYDDSIEDYISTSKVIYDHSGSRRKNIFPGGFDEYRYDSYVRDDKSRSFHVSSCL